jgi:hypothetical protein
MLHKLGTIWTVLAWTFSGFHVPPLSVRKILSYNFVNINIPTNTNLLFNEDIVVGNDM